MHQPNIPEQFAQQPQVQQLLLDMLVNPIADHSAAVLDALGGVTFCVAYSVSLLRASCKLDALIVPSMSGRKPEITKNKGVAYHTWLYHFLGGETEKLVPPPTCCSAASTAWSVRLRTEAARFEVEYKREVERLRRKGDTAQDDLKELRGAPVDPVLLRRVDRVARRGGGSDPPHPDGSNNTSEWQLQTARLVAFAMGTHPRLGLGYASRDQPCGVRRIAGQHDVLRNIAAHVRNLPPRTLAPPKPELVQLRALNVELYSKNLQLQELVTELSVRMDAAEAAEQRALRREDCAARRTEAALIEAQYAFQKGVQQGASEQAVKVKALKKVLRCERQEHKDTAVQVQLTEQRVYNEGTNRVRAAIAELRQQNVDAAVARDMAVADAVARGETAAQLQAALERVRCTSKAVLLQQVAEQREEIRKLGERRKAGQRTIAEANLDRRRMKLAQERAAAAEAHVAEYFITDEAQRQRAERADSLEKQVTDLQSEVKELTKMMAKYRAVAEPPKEKFYNKGAYTADVDLTALEVIASVGVAATAVPKLFIIFARFFGIKIPSRKVSVLARVVNGQRIYENKEVPYIPGNTHMKELPAIGGELHKIQAGEWLANDVTGRYCYINDGANSQQKDEIVHILSKRNKSTGRLESMVLSLDEITDKSSEGQYAKFKATLEAIAGAWEEAEGLGLLDSEHGDSSCMTESKDGAETPQDARSFFQNQRKRWRAELRGNIAHLTAAASMNDRASTARKTARLARGGDASGGDGDVSDDPTCAHHAVANIGEEGRKAIDTRLKTKMNITLEQSEADSAKIKALRTNVGWFSSPACSLIYQVCKYVALFSSKGYAIGENFAQWLAHKLKTTERLAGELIGHVEDLLAICGGRDYVFFLDAGVVDRFSQIESLYGFLLEETDLGAEAGGKLRKAIITGFESVYCMAAVKSMAIISDVWLWPMLRAIEPGDDVHILDVCPHLWPRTCAWLEEAAEDPLSAIDGSICLHSSFEAAQLRTVSRHEEGATAKRRSERAQLDLERIRAAIDGDVELRTEVLAMLSTAFMAMAAAVRNHASEFMPGGPFCLANITVQLRERLDGVPLTSVSAETMFARLKRRAERTGRARHDTQTGALLCDRDKTIAWARSKGDTKASGLWDVSRKRWRKGSGQRTIADERALKGAEKAPERTEKLSKKRRSRTKKLEELERLKQVTLASKYSELKSMRNDELSDQLKIYKVLEKKTGFITTGTRVELVLAVQLHMYEKFGESANDLEDGDSGVEGRGVRRRKVGSGAIEGKARKRKRGNIVQLRGWEWDSSEEFVIDRLIGKMVADGVTDVPGREGERIAANTVLYKVLWEGFPPEIATWEEEDNIPCGEKDFVSDYESSLEEELKLDKEDNGALSSDSDVDA